MTTPADRHPSRPPTHPSQGPGERQVRPPRQPLFPLEDDDIGSRARHSPPSPLGDLLGDIDEALSFKAALPPLPPPGPQAAERRSPEPSNGPGAAPAQSARRAPAVAPDRAPSPPLVATAERPSPQSAVLRPTPADRLVKPKAAPTRAARARLDTTMADRNRLEHEAAARGQLRIGDFVPPEMPAMSMSHLAWMSVIILASLLVISTLRGEDDTLGLSRWGAMLSGNGAEGARRALFSGHARPVGEYVLRAPPSISAGQIDSILASYSSPASGTGEIWYDLGLRYGIDPAFAVAFFIHESAAGTAQAWAGLKSEGGTTHNVGNIICAGYANCYGRFRDYPSWAEGIEDWYRLIDVEYLKGRGHQTVADIIPVYAPSVENDVQGYINVVQAMVDEWRSQGTP